MSLIISETQTSGVEGRLASSFDRDLNSSVGNGKLNVDAKLQNVLHRLALAPAHDVAIADTNVIQHTASNQTQETTSEGDADADAAEDSPEQDPALDPADSISNVASNAPSPLLQANDLVLNDILPLNHSATSSGINVGEFDRRGQKLLTDGVRHATDRHHSLMDDSHALPAFELHMDGFAGNLHAASQRGVPGRSVKTKMDEQR